MKRILLFTRQIVVISTVLLLLSTYVIISAKNHKPNNYFLSPTSLLSDWQNLLMDSLSRETLLTKLNTVSKDDNIDEIIEAVLALPNDKIDSLQRKTTSTIGTEILYWIQMARKWNQTDMRKVPLMTDVAQFQEATKRYGQIDQAALATYLLFRYNRINLNVITNKLSLGDISFSHLESDLKRNSQIIRETKERIIALEQLTQLTKIKDWAIDSMEKYNHLTDKQRQVLRQFADDKGKRENALEKFREANRQAKFHIRDTAESQIKAKINELIAKHNISSNKAKQILNNKAKRLIDEIHEEVEPNSNYRERHLLEDTAERNQFITRVVYDAELKKFRMLLAFDDVVTFSRGNGRKNIADKDVALSYEDKLTLLKLSPKTNTKKPRTTTSLIRKTEINYVSVLYSENDAVGKFLNERGITDAFNFSVLINEKPLNVIYTNKNVVDQLESLEHEQNELYYLNELSQIPNLKKALLRIKNLNQERIAHIFAWGKQIDAYIKRGKWETAKDSPFIKKQLESMTLSELQKVIDTDRTEHDKLRRRLLDKNKTPFFSLEACNRINTFEQSVKDLAITIKIAKQLNQLKPTENFDKSIDYLCQLADERIEEITPYVTNPLAKKLIKYVTTANKWAHVKKDRSVRLPVVVSQFTNQQITPENKPALVAYMLFKEGNVNLQTSYLRLGSIPFSQLEPKEEKNISTQISEIRDTLSALAYRGEIDSIAKKAILEIQSIRPSASQEADRKKIAKAQHLAIDRFVMSIINTQHIKAPAATTLLQAKATLYKKLISAAVTGKETIFEKTQEEAFFKMRQEETMLSIYNTTSNAFELLRELEGVYVFGRATTERIDNELVNKLKQYQKRRLTFDQFLKEFSPIFEKYFNILEDDTILKKILTTLKELKITTPQSTVSDALLSLKSTHQANMLALNNRIRIQYVVQNAA